jgi:hypothetical protein
VRVLVSDANVANQAVKPAVKLPARNANPASRDVKRVARDIVKDARSASIVRMVAIPAIPVTQPVINVRPRARQIARITVKQHAKATVNNVTTPVSDVKAVTVLVKAAIVVNLAIPRVKVAMEVVKSVIIVKTATRVKAAITATLVKTVVITVTIAMLHVITAIVRMSGGQGNQLKLVLQNHSLLSKDEGNAWT